MADPFENSDQIDVRFQKFASVFNDILKENEQLKGIIKTLQTDLELCRSTGDFLKVHVLEKITSDSQTVQYAKLLAKISELEAEVALQKEEQKKEYATFEEEKMGLLNELKKEKQSRDEIELKLTNDLQVANNLAAIQYDELELKMQERVGSMTVQLKEANNTCNMLRNEVFTLKQKLANVNNSEEKIKRLEEQLCALKNAQNFENSSRVKNDNIGQANKSNTATIVSYDKERFFQPMAFKTNVSFNHHHITEKQTQHFKRRYEELPPLAELRLNSTKTPTKKRKLFNPDDLNYMDKERQE